MSTQSPKQGRTVAELRISRKVDSLIRTQTPERATPSAVALLAALLRNGAKEGAGN